MHNLFANIVIILEGCKCFAKDLVNVKGNVPSPGPGVFPRSSELFS